MTQQLDAKLDWSTFQFGNIAFGNTVVSVPSGLTSYSAQVDLTATLGIDVDITASFNTLTGLATWTFTSIDPATKDVPADPLAGFLPPDQANGEGLGFVDYTIQPMANVVTGNTIGAQATVVFDQNAPISTVQIINTIDNGLPTSHVDPLPATAPPSFTVAWSGADDPGGSGVASYSVYVSDDGGSYTAFQTATTATSAVFTGQVGHTYGFYSVATDQVGNVQETPTAAQATTTVHSVQATSLSAISGSGTYGGTSVLTATLTAGGAGIPNELVAFSFVSGGTVTTVGSATTDGDGIATLAGVGLGAIGAGTYVGHVGASFAGDSTYGGTSGTGDLAVAKATLTIAANDATRAAGQPDPAFAAGYSGFVLGQGPGDLSGTLGFSTPATSASPAGSYPVVPGGLSSPNYAIQFVAGTLVVTPSNSTPVTVTGLQWHTVKPKHGKARTELVIDFSGALDPGTADDRAAYVLDGAKRVRKRGLVYSKALPLASAAYSSANHAVTLLLRGQKPKQQAQLTISADLVRDAAGQPLDGNHDGLAGGNFVATLGARGVISMARPMARPAAGRVIDAAIGALMADESSPLLIRKEQRHRQ